MNLSEEAKAKLKNAIVVDAELMFEVIDNNMAALSKSLTATFDSAKLNGDLEDVYDHLLNFGAKTAGASIKASLVKAMIPWPELKELIESAGVELHEQA